MKRKNFYRSLRRAEQIYSKGYADGVRAGKVIGIQQERNIPKRFTITLNLKDVIIGNPVMTTLEVEPPTIMRMKSRTYFAQMFKDLVYQTLKYYHEQIFK